MFAFIFFRIEIILTNKKKQFTVFILLAAVFSFDILTPLGIADGMLYVIIVMMTIWAEKKSLIIIVACTAISFTFLGYFLSPSSGIEVYIAPFNRILSVISIVATTIIVLNYKRMETVVNKQMEEMKQLSEKLKLSNNQLEEKVNERTKVLEESLEELEKSKSELGIALEHEKELNELKSRIVTMVSHEFRTPLAIILSSISLITKYTKTNDKENQLKHINKIKSVIDYLTELIEGTLSVTKLDEGKFSFNAEEINIPNLLHNVIKGFENKSNTLSGKKISYTHLGAEIIINDKIGLKQILLNLISNAMKFSNGSSEIKLFTETTSDYFILKVEDGGIGISKKDQLHLFERFFRGENASNIQGTGLGLYIVARYIELLKGSIDVKSKLNEGSEFTVKIPL
jgi:signal transduction histidine kinase